MDAEEVVRAALVSAGISAYYEVPTENVPAAYATVQRSGGGHHDLVVEDPQVIIHCRAQTNKAARDMAHAVKDAVLSIPEIFDSAFASDINTTYRDDDIDTGQNRWKVVAELTMTDS